MAKEEESLQKSLARLAPEARARVEAELKQAVEQELAQSAVGGAELRAAKEFSKGWFFSRSRPVSLVDEGSLVQQAATMDEEAFARFANRLRSLRAAAQGIESGGGQ